MKLKINLENNIDSMKTNNAELNHKVSEFQDVIVKVESESKDSIRLKTDLENKNKIQRSREEYFKNEIKKGINSINDMTSILESNRKDLEQFGNIRDSLNK